MKIGKENKLYMDRDKLKVLKKAKVYFEEQEKINFNLMEGADFDDFFITQNYGGITLVLVK